MTEAGSPPDRPGAAPDRFGLLHFARSAGVLSISSLANFVRAVITAKLFAITLGPSAVGVLSQILNFSAFVFTILPLGLTTGVTKMVSESAGDRHRVDRVVGTSAAISLLSGLTALVLMAPFSGRISYVLTGTPRYGFLVLLVLLSFPLNNLAQVLGYVLQGFTDIRGLTLGNVLTAVATIVAVVLGTLRYGLTGAIGSVLVTSVIQAAVFIALVALSYRARRWTAELRWASDAARELVGYGWIMILAGMAIWGSVLATRTLSVRVVGDYQNGIYQVAFGLSLQYMTVYMTWMAAYVFPRLTGSQSRPQLNSLLNSALRANLFLMVPVLTLAVTLRDPLIHLFYSAAFLPAAPLLVIQAFGDYARVVGWSFGVALFAQGRTRAYLLAIVVQAAGWVAITSVTLGHLGIAALALGYALSYLSWPLLMYPLVRQGLGVRISPASVRLVLLGLVILVLAAVTPPPFGVPLVVLLPLVVWARRVPLRLG